MTDSLRYVTDVPYVAGFTRELAPAWLDLVAVINGFAPPVQGPAFAWCELGCGPGLSSIIFAASHGRARFHGIDGMPTHIERGRKIAGDAGIDNLTLHALDFAAALNLDLPKFHYIVAHGVYSWIDAAARLDFRRFIDRHLAPGGLVYVSYNTMPGWAMDTPFQHLVKAFAAGEEGDSVTRFFKAATAIASLTQAGAAALRASPIATEWKEEKEKRPPAYFAHEYLAPAWEPLYVDDVRAGMAEIGLAPIGSATFSDNFDSFVLRQAARESLAAIADDDLRELAKDYFLFQRFRRDVFGRAPEILSDEQRQVQLLAFHFALMKPPSLVKYGTDTEAGTLNFDNPVARRIVAALADGPRPLSELADGPDAQDLIANALTLCCAGVVQPVSRERADVGRLNETLLTILDARTETTFRVLACGTALRFDGQILVALRDGRAIPAEAEAWAEFLRHAK